MKLFEEMDKKEIVQLRVLPNIGMEGTAEFVYHKVDKMIRDLTDDRAWVSKVEVRENVKNSAIFIPD